MIRNLFTKEETVTLDSWLTTCLTNSVSLQRTESELLLGSDFREISIFFKIPKLFSTKLAIVYLQTNDKIIEELGRLLSSLFLLHLTFSHLCFMTLFFIPLFIEPVLLVFYLIFLSHSKQNIYIILVLIPITLIALFIKLCLIQKTLQRFLLINSIYRNSILLEKALIRILREMQINFRSQRIFDVIRLFFIK